ncbi:MAG: response regulator, partial [Deltaproteobacteria bacterium]|nr:response regulator [Deltaproteobacteria bacterium]
MRKDLRGCLLVVDDDETNRKILSGRLESEGHKVSVAENGRRALEIIQAEPFDLIIRDILMPEMDGYQVLKH